MRAGKLTRVLIAASTIVLPSVFFLFISFSPLDAWCATYYVCDTISACNANGGSGWSGTPSDSNTCTSKSNACKSIAQGGLAKMSGGDTLIIGNGTYYITNSNLSNMIYSNDSPYTQIPAGTSGAWTTIQAENDGGAIIDAYQYTGGGIPIAIFGQTYIEGTGGSGDGSAYNNPGPHPQSYIVVRGLQIQPSGLTIVNADHIKIVNCIGLDAGQEGSPFTASVSDHILFEGCVSYGQGRTRIILFHAHRSIVRNCIGRMDYSPITDNPVSGMDNYSSVYTEWQNDIVIDMAPANVGGNTMNGLLCAASTSNVNCVNLGVGCTSGPVNFTNNIVLNNRLNFQETDFLAYQPVINVRDTVGWDLHLTNTQAAGATSGPLVEDQGNTSFNHVTLGLATKNDYASNPYWLASYSPNSPEPSNAWSNSIFLNLNSTDPIFNCSAGATWTVDHINVYGCGTVIQSGSEGCTTLTNLTTTNPQSNGLLYLPRIETNGALYTAGASGTYEGANIVYQYGKTGTLYGDAGYNELQDGVNNPNSGYAVVKLWPWGKNAGAAGLSEDLIKSKMAAYSNNGVTGARGFCTGTSKDGTAQTLTKYIWEYLGNQIPADIYGGRTVLQAPLGLRLLQSN